MKYFIIVISLVLIGLSGCGSEKRVVVKEKSLPNWYTNPPKSTNEDLYALGEGSDKKEAISEALSYMASTLSVSISSKYNAKTTLKEGSINSSDAVYKSEIQSDVKEIRISNYEVLESKNLGFKRYAVLVKSNKERLFKSLKQELNQKFDVIESEVKLYSQLDALKQVAYYKKTLKSLDFLDNRLIVMSDLESSFDSKSYLQRREELQRNYMHLVKKISFSIQTDKESRELKGVIAKALSAKHFKINNKQSDLHYRVMIKAKVNPAESYGFILARATITIVTKNSKDVIVGSNTLNIVGQSSQGLRIAKQNIAIKLNRIIKKDGVSKVLALPV